MNLIYMKNKPLGGTHLNGLPRRLVLTQRQKPTRKWPITFYDEPNTFTYKYNLRGPLML